MAIRNVREPPRSCDDATAVTPAITVVYTLTRSQTESDRSVYLEMMFWNESCVSAYNFSLEYGIAKRLASHYRACLMLSADI